MTRLTAWLSRVRSALRKLGRKGLLYWLTVVFLVWIGSSLGNWLERQEFALTPRYRLYQWMQTVSPRKPFIQRTVMVLIDDDDYWKSDHKGDLERRVPIKRDYLARLICALDEADPAVIALDFDLRSPMPDGSVIEHGDYTDETKQFLEAVEKVSQNRPVVLARTIGFEDGYYVAESNIYDDNTFSGGNVREGYISLPFDVRRVPLELVLKDGKVVPSFAKQIVEATNENALEPVKGQQVLPYGTYLDSNAFLKFNATDILNRNPDAFRKLHHNTVIVGGAWSRLAYGRGGKADLYATPVGPLQGALIHANFVEALLDNRTSKPWSETVLKVIEIVVTFAVAVVFALISQPVGKLLSILGILVGLVFFSLLSQVNLGFFYDFSVPVVLVCAHSVYEQLNEWRHRARHPSEAASAG
jgi:CHASE2 domain-containing sensor protein